MSYLLGKIIRRLRNSDSDSDIPNITNEGVIDCSMVTVLQSTDMFDSEKGLHDAAAKNDLEKIGKYLKAKVRVDSTNQLGRTPLMLAAANGHEQAVELLIGAGANIHVTDKFGITVLHWTASGGSMTVFANLVNTGADMTTVSKQGLTCLHFAAQKGHIEAVTGIIERFSALKGDEKDKSGQTIMHYAAANGNTALVEVLKRVKGNLNLRDNAGQLPLHIAAKEGHVETVKFLMEQYEQQLNEKDEEGNAPIHLAAENGSSDVVSMILNADCNPNIMNHKLMTPLHLAVWNNRIEVVDLLIERGALLDQKNEAGCSALHLAVQSNNTQIVDMLMAAGCDINCTNLRNVTPLHICCENGYVIICEKLLVAGANTSIKDKMGRTSLGMASRGEFVAIVDMIIRAERYYANQEPSDEPDGHVVGIPKVAFSRGKFPTFVENVIWKLSRKSIKPDEWKLLAKHWNFTDDQILAIEQQETGPNIYKEQAYRVMMIWLHGASVASNPVKGLFEALVALGHTTTAERTRRKINQKYVRQEKERIALLKKWEAAAKEEEIPHP